LEGGSNEYRGGGLERGVFMADDPDPETEKGRDEILKDMDATLRRMLETPPKPHKKMSYPRKSKARESRAPSSKR
jgi:hypothetical protein